MDPDQPDWREPVLEILSERGTDSRLIALDPRIEGYDPIDYHQHSWEHLDPVLDWELRGVQLADQVVFGFQAGTRSPIALLELGIVHLRAQDVIVYCPSGYWRYEFVALFCRRFMIRHVASLDELGELARYRL